MSAREAQTFLTFQDLILRLQQYWAERGCVVMQPYDMARPTGSCSPRYLLDIKLGPVAVVVWRAGH